MIEYIGLLTFISIVTMLIVVSLLVKIENRSILRILKKLGIDVYLKDMEKYFKILQSINKDAIAFINIEGVCQCPVMLGDYGEKDINKRYSSVGELYILNNSLASAFQSISNNKDSDDILLKDMTVIRGSIRNKNCTSMGAKFSLLRQYIHTLKISNTPNFVVYEGDKKRNFKILYGVDLKIEDLPSFSCSSRLELLSKLESKAYYTYNYHYGNKVSLENNMLVFISSMDIDTHLVVAVEV